MGVGEMIGCNAGLDACVHVFRFDDAVTKELEFFFTVVGHCLVLGFIGVLLIGAAEL